MKKIYLILLILPFCFSANAQKFIKIEDKTFNWGGKVGVNAALPIVKSLTIDNQEMEDIRLQYKVGYQAAVFARVNIDRFYIQPSLAWQYTEGDIRFNIPQTENSLPDGTNTQMPIGKNRITYKSATLEVPVMIGYYLVKDPQSAYADSPLGDGAFGSTDNFPVLPRAPSLRELASRSDD